MTTTTAEPETTNGQVIQYGVTDAAIEALRHEFATVSFDNPKNYQIGVKALAEVRSLRTSVERKRVEYKADALAWGRKVDAEAKRVTGLLLAIEEPLKEKKAAVDEAKERAEREAEEAAWRAEQERILAERQAEEAKLKAEREAEEARQKIERERLKAENDRLAAERAELDAAQEIHRAAQRKIEAERYALDAEKRRQAREEADRLAKIKHEEEAAARAERERIALAERQAAEEQRREAMRPDVEKVRGFGEALELWAHQAAPDCGSGEAKTLISTCLFQIGEVAEKLRRFGA